MLTKGQTAAADIAALLRARNPILWVTTKEEARVQRHLMEAAASANYAAHTWDIAQGAADMAGNPEPGEPLNDPGAMLTAILGRAKGSQSSRDVWIMRDLPIWLQGPPGAATLRQLRNLAATLPTTPRDRAQAIIVLSPSGEVPPELAGSTTVIEFPLPDRAEIASLLDAAIASLPDTIRDSAAPNGTREAAIDAAVGLSSDEASSCYAKSLVQLKRIDPVAVAAEKKRVITRERVLEWFDPLPGGLDAVGGLENLKAWLNARKSAYTPEARAYGLPAPKGAMLVGVPGCGKSLTAKAIATAWGIPLLKVDLGALKSKFVGESESNLRKAFQVIETIGRCVVWFDEIEKALAGSTGPQGDGGVSSDALGAILGWMQERRGEAFVIATANNVSQLPPELLRKGRFDEVFFVDLPNAGERAAILSASLRQHGRGEVEGIELDTLAKMTDGFTGSEIAALVPDALFAAFADKAREIRTIDLINARGGIVPLSQTMKEKITELREWSKGRARMATAATEAPQSEASRQIDL